ncbi:metallophosphoesterase [Leptolyngbya iicbica]|nr:metallophosphoesterase [Leptolyngbya sp. LK]
MLIEPLITEHVTVAVTDLPERLQGTVVVQLSDFHFDGRSLALKVLQEAIARCNAIAPDLIVLTGDFITHEPQDIEGLVLYLKQLRSRTGVYAILGNHDHHHPQARSRVVAGLQSVGICPLWNEVAYPFGADFPLVGLADFYARAFAPEVVFQQLDEQVPRLVLSHNPDSVVMLQPYRADVVLSGHTHGGQVILPRWGPVPALLQTWGAVVPKWARPLVPFLKQDCDRLFRNWQWSAGLHQVGATQLYVNRGLGSYFPGRWRCPPELTVLRLVHAG